MTVTSPSVAVTSPSVVVTSFTSVTEQFSRTKQILKVKKSQEPFSFLCILGLKEWFFCLLFGSIDYFSNRNTNVLKSIFFSPANHQKVSPGLGLPTNWFSYVSQEPQSLIFLFSWAEGNTYWYCTLNPSQWKAMFHHLSAPDTLLCKPLQREGIHMCFTNSAKLRIKGIQGSKS